MELTRATNRQDHAASRITATAAILAMAAMEIAHTFVQRAPWRGFDVEMNRVSYVLLPLFGLAIAGLWSRRAALKPWLVIGLLASLTHAVVLAATMNPGWFYFLATLVAGGAAALAHWPESWRQGHQPGSVLPFPPRENQDAGRKLAQF